MASFASSPLRVFGNITGITATKGPSLPLGARVHPDSGPQRFEQWLELAADLEPAMTRTELEVRFNAAVAEHDYWPGMTRSSSS
jgi:hypothetical protein